MTNKLLNAKRLGIYPLIVFAASLTLILFRKLAWVHELENGAFAGYIRDLSGRRRCLGIVALP